MHGSSDTCLMHPAHTIYARRKKLLSSNLLISSTCSISIYNFYKEEVYRKSYEMEYYVCYLVE